MINAKATIFKKIKLSTFETIGSGPIHLPEEELHTNALWLSIAPDVVEAVGEGPFDQALTGLAHLLQHVAPVFVMCDRHDLHVIPQMKAEHSERPTIFIYDRYPGGIGLAKAVYQNLDTIIVQVEELLHSCPCQSGCPACIGLVDGSGQNIKTLIKRLLNLLKKQRNEEASWSV